MKQSIKMYMFLVTKKNFACYSRNEDIAVGYITHGLEPKELHFGPYVQNTKYTFKYTFESIGLPKDYQMTPKELMFLK